MFEIQKEGGGAPSASHGGPCQRPLGAGPTQGRATLIPTKGSRAKRAMGEAGRSGAARKGGWDISV